MTQVLVKTTDNEHFSQQIKAGKHSFVVDIPIDKGGEETGPDPHELLLASLGACTSVTLQMYAKKKGWELKNVAVDLTQEEIDDPADQTKKLTKITRSINVDGNLTQEQVDTLKSIADKCPIHKLLSGPKQINTEIRKG
jgi:putative redox protein